MFQTPKFWLSRGLKAHLFIPVAVMYFLCKRLIELFKYRVKYQPKSEVIIIGNAVMGGAGKTPIVKAMHEVLLSYESYKIKKIAILLKGYNGRIKEPTIVDIDKHKFIDVGDEALIHAKYCDTIIANDRVSGVKFAEALGYDVIIIDDGLHDKRLEICKKILVIDGNYGFGNRMIFPSGALRDRVDISCDDINAVIVIDEDIHGSVEFLMSRLELSYKARKKDISLLQNIKICHAIIKSEDSLPKVLDVKQGDKFIAFASIARPEKFFQYLKDKKGLTLDKELSYPDHYRYTESDVEYIIDKGVSVLLSNNSKSDNDATLYILSTEKDDVKVCSIIERIIAKHELSDRISYISVNINAKIIDGERILSD